MGPDAPRIHPRPRSSHLGMALLTQGAIALTGHVTPDLVTWMPLGQLEYSNGYRNLRSEFSLVVHSLHSHRMLSTDSVYKFTWMPT